MPDVALHVGKDLTGISLVPSAIQVLGRKAELNDEITGVVLGLDFAALFPPEPEKGGLIIAHNDPGIRAADEISTVDLPDWPVV